MSAQASWHPNNFARRKANLAIRQKVIAAIRVYFANENFAEVETPILQTSAGGEVHLHAFATELKGVRPDEVPQKLYLHTSPELAMKKLLVAGVPRLYQLARVFRNGERSSLHHPEFLMCEWYRGGQESGVRDQGKDLLAPIEEDCIALVRGAAKAGGREKFSANGIVCDPFKEWERLTVPDAFKRYADIDILTATDVSSLAQEVKRIGLRASDIDTWDDLFFRVMGEKIEPCLGKDQPTFLCDYPISQAALARPKPEDSRLAERFELYICGIELANAFGELTDADEQQKRLHADMAMKQKLYGETWPIDEDFIAALRHGMPPSAGIALGIDRLVMLCAGAKHIEDVLWLPVAGK